MSSPTPPADQNLSTDNFPPLQSGSTNTRAPLWRQKLDAAGSTPEARSGLTDRERSRDGGSEPQPQPRAGHSTPATLEQRFTAANQLQPNQADDVSRDAGELGVDEYGGSGAGAPHLDSTPFYQDFPDARELVDQPAPLPSPFPPTQRGGRTVPFRGRCPVGEPRPRGLRSRMRHRAPPRSRRDRRRRPRLHARRGMARGLISARRSLVHWPVRARAMMGGGPLHHPTLDHWPLATSRGGRRALAPRPDAHQNPPSPRAVQVEQEGAPGTEPMEEEYHSRPINPSAGLMPVPPGAPRTVVYLPHGRRAIWNEWVVVHGVFDPRQSGRR